MRFMGLIGIVIMAWLPHTSRAVTITDEEQQVARRWAGAKFEGDADSTGVRPYLTVQANRGSIQQNSTYWGALRIGRDAIHAGNLLHRA